MLKQDKRTMRFCIEWAKDRLCDDFRDVTARGYAGLGIPDRRRVQRLGATFNLLISLPEDAWQSLVLLAAYNYWNGDKDSIWEKLQPIRRLPKGCPAGILKVHA